MDKIDATAVTSLFLRKKALKTFARIKISITFALAFKAMAR
ncbi:hypothetical protein [Alistipes communis]